MKEIKTYGDRALLINFDQRIDPEINQAVIQLSQAIEAAKWVGVQYLIPAYCSLTLAYDPSLTNYQALKTAIETLHHSSTEPSETGHRKIVIPVCYENHFAWDLADIAKATQLSPEEIIRLHTSTTFRVYMLGFLPGFVYMGRLPETLKCKRKTTPRLKVPAQAVALAGFQTGIYPSEAPGGWQIIGKTPVRVFDPRLEDPFLFRPGDRVSFRSISRKEFELIEQEEIHLKYKPQIQYD